MKFKLEKNTNKILAFFLLLFSLVYIGVSLGKATWSYWASGIFGIFLIIFLFTESAMMEYFRKKQYRAIGFEDIVQFITLVLIGGLIINVINTFGLVGSNPPAWIVNVSMTSGVTIGIGGVLLAIYYMFAGKP